MKPIFFPEVIDQIKDVVAEDTLIVSIAAGRTLDYLKEAFGRSELKLIRCMPNTPALVLEGCTGVCAEENVTEEDMEQVLALLRSFGIASVVPERLMDVVVGVSGSSPAYVFMFIEARQTRRSRGMPRKQAYEFAGTIRPWQCQDGAGDRQTSRRTEGHGVLPRVEPRSRQSRYWRKKAAAPLSWMPWMPALRSPKACSDRSTMNRVESKSHVNMILPNGCKPSCYG